MQRNSKPEGVSIIAIEIENFPRSLFRETYTSSSIHLEGSPRSSAPISYLRLPSRSDSRTTKKKCDGAYGAFLRPALAEITILRTFSFLVSTLARHLNLIQLSDFTIPTASLAEGENRIAIDDGFSPSSRIHNRAKSDVRTSESGAGLEWKLRDKTAVTLEVSRAVRTYAESQKLSRKYLGEYRSPRRYPGDGIRFIPCSVRLLGLYGSTMVSWGFMGNHAAAARSARCTADHPVVPCFFE